ncbi:hypothetical protein [Novosphingobium sp.]|uniref:hypothetical protein n=1 Tax=Novosphingobium sp. TaxID=1874826 RepID=UPI00286CB225|nr:hypothetical protein [Novosphingobium sp.]
MKAFGYKALLAAGLIASSTAAWACADSSCYPTWKLFGSGNSCEGRGFLTPGNDTRINLAFLLADRGGPNTVSRPYPKDSYDTAGYGDVFLDPAAAAYYAVRTGKEGEQASETAPYAGTRCAGFAAASKALAAAMQASKGLPVAEAAALKAARSVSEVTCTSGNDGVARPGLGAWPTVSSRPGREFLGYIQAADAFYAGQWDQTRSALAAIGSASDPWVRETAAYLSIRTEYAAAQAGAFSEYGDFDLAKVDRSSVRRGLVANAAYLKAWPSGRYAASAQGLVRRGLWLAGDNASLAREYERVLSTIDPFDPAAGDLVYEVDNKWLFSPSASAVPPQGAMVLAVQDLMQMRRAADPSGKEWLSPTLSAAQLDAQKEVFAAQPELFSFLQATHAFYIGGNPRKVLTLLPDDAKQARYTNLAFSRQVLRGQALASLKDRNEEGFWLDLLGGAKGQWQRPTVELGLAMNWERSGKLASVFAKESPITESLIRRQLILNAAAPDMLRGNAADSSRPQYERDLAVFTLLHKDLTHGDFAAFGKDQALVRPGAGTDGYMYYLPDQQDLPLGLFTKGKWSDGYSCQALAQTAKALAVNPQAVSARLCLGDFWRLNGFDQVDIGDTPRKADELGGFADLFPGKSTPRSAIYTSVIANPKVAGPDKAYALYRAVMCYAPSGYNGCGGKDVPKSQRKAWYDQLKATYPTSPWARKLRYFW